MLIQTNIDLSKLSTFGLAAKARYLIEFDDTSQLYELSSIMSDIKLPSLTVGGGSNIIFCNDYPGVIIKSHYDEITKNSGCQVTVGSGLIWDEFVSWTVEQNLSGIEPLSGIPGTVGGAVALNAGAYGVSVKDCLESVLVYDVARRTFKNYLTSELKYWHRTSIFREKRGNDWLIVSATFRLHHKLSPPKHPKLIESLVGLELTPSTIRNHTLQLRKHLPDPRKVRNCGSFFLNPTVTNTTAELLKSAFPDISMRPYNSTHQQIAAGWLIDDAGLKGASFGEFTMHPKHANIVINSSSSAYGSSLSEFIACIQRKIYDRFGIVLTPEPLLIGEEYWQGLALSSETKLSHYPLK